MKTASLVLGIVTILGMLVGFIPCLGWFNWFNLPLAFVGLVIGIIALSKAKEGEAKGGALAGLILSGIALVFGTIRLILGGGVL